MAFFRDKHVYIINTRSGLVLDVVDNRVKLQHFTKSTSQLWKLEHVGLGRFVITNKDNGKVLDIEEGAKLGNNVITFAKHGGVNQQWYINYDGTIASAAEGNLTLDIWRYEYNAGNRVVAFRNHGKDNQKFTIKEQ